MIIQDLNPHGGIGANCTACKIGPFQFVLDAGLHPKYAGKDSLPRLDLLPPDSVDFILLSHCHLDHLGSLPLLSRNHPRAPLFLSYPSSILVRRMLSNSLAVMKRQRSELNLPELPLYGRSDLSSLYERMEVLPLEETTLFEKEGHAIEITAYHAGHVAGAVSFELKYDGKRTFFTGDVLFNDLRTLDGAQLPRHPIDTLVMETTRGGAERPAGRQREAEIVRLLQDVRKVLNRGGSALIPVFALGRMQEMLVVLDEARKKKGPPPHSRILFWVGHGSGQPHPPDFPEFQPCPIFPQSIAKPRCPALAPQDSAWGTSPHAGHLPSKQWHDGGKHAFLHARFLHARG